MTFEWKKAIRKKKRYAKRYARNPTEENRGLMKTWRNTATRLWRRAIKRYWSKKAEDLITNPKNFYVFLSLSSLKVERVWKRSNKP